MKSLTERERIRYNIGTALLWLTQAQSSLDWQGEGTAAFELSKSQLQKALPLIRDAIVDLDGLVQDERNKAGGIDPEYEAAVADRPAECPEADGVNPSFEAYWASQGGD